MAKASVEVQTRITIDIENLSDLELDELKTKYENIKAACVARQQASCALKQKVVDGPPQTGKQIASQR